MKRPYGPKLVVTCLLIWLMATLLILIKSDRYFAVRIEWEPDRGQKAAPRREFYTTMHTVRLIEPTTSTAKKEETKVPLTDYRPEEKQRTDATICPPAAVLSSGEVNMLGQFPLRKTFLTMGIATVTRDKTNYLLQTLKGIMQNLNEEDKQDVHIVVFLADISKERRRSQQKILSEGLGNFTTKGILHIIEAPSKFYPPLDNLKRKWGDSPDRVKWRSKQNIDYAFLMCYCKGLSSYYLHLEDDVRVAPSFFPKLRDFINSQKQPWRSLDASMQGHIGKVYHSEDLGSAASLFYVLYDEMPVDWLMLHWRAMTSESRDSRFIFHTAGLFEHLGVHSSLAGKVMNSTEQFFDKYDHKYLGLNPAAHVTSSFSPQKETRPADAYERGIGYFWAAGPKADDTLQISFKDPVHVSAVSVETGSYVAPKDILKSGRLQISNDLGSCSKFETVGNFKKGNIWVNIDQSVTCIRMLVLQGQDNWVFVREINVWTNPAWTPT